MFTLITGCEDMYPYKNFKNSKNRRRVKVCRRRYSCGKLSMQNKCAEPLRNVLPMKCKTHMRKNIQKRPVKQDCRLSCRTTCRSMLVQLIHFIIIPYINSKNELVASFSLLIH